MRDDKSEKKAKLIKKVVAKKPASRKSLKIAAVKKKPKKATAIKRKA